MMKPIKAYVLMHRYGWQTRIRPWAAWLVAALAIVVAVLLVYAVW